MSDRAAHSLENVTLFYFFSSGREFPSAAILDGLARERGLTFVACAAGPFAPEFQQQFDGIVRSAGPEAVQVSFCGRKGLLKAVQQLMREANVPRRTCATSTSSSVDAAFAGASNPRRTQRLQPGRLRASRE